MSNWNDLVALAGKNTWTAAPKTPAVRITEGAWPAVSVPAPSTNDESQDFYAQYVAANLSGKFVCTPEQGWLAWNGHRWSEDTLNGHIQEIRVGLRTLLPGQKRLHFNAGYISGVEKLTGLDPLISRSVTEFDTDRYAINTPAGMVDLFTGEVHPPNPRVLVSKSTAFGPVFGVETPMFDRMLSGLFAGDQETSQYLLAAMGLSMIGAQDHQVFFMLNGVGGSGKGTVMNIVQSLLGTDDAGYAISVEASMFTAGRRDGHPTEIARLRGKRMVVSSEITEAVALDTAKLKNLTGGDKLSGHFMRQDYFTFDATHTLWIMTNYRPRVSVDDSGFWRRLREVPFLHKPETVIEGLADRIIAEEGPAVLGKIILAAREYLQSGLTVPESVRLANEANKGEQDTVQRFIEEACDTGGTASVPFRTLHDAYSAWCKRNSYSALGDRAFGNSLTTHGFENGRGTGNVAVRTGLRLTESSDYGYVG